MTDYKLLSVTLLFTTLLLASLATACAPPLNNGPVPAMVATEAPLAPILNLTLNPNTTTLYSGEVVLIQVSAEAQQSSTDFAWTHQESDTLSPGMLSADTGTSVVYTAPGSGTGTVRITVTRATDNAVGLIDFAINEGRRP